MEKFKFDSENLKQKVVKHLEESELKLQTLINNANDMYIPRGFRDYTYLEKLHIELSNIKKSLNSLNLWIDDSNIKLERIISNIVLDIKDIDDIEIKKI